MSLHLWSTALALDGTVTPSFHRGKESCHSSVAVQSKWAKFGSIPCRIYSTIINQWCCIMHGAESVLGTDAGTARSCTSRLCWVFCDAVRVCSDTYPLASCGHMRSISSDLQWAQMLSSHRGEIMWLTQSSLTWWSGSVWLSVFFFAFYSCLSDTFSLRAYFHYIWRMWWIKTYMYVYMYKYISTHHSHIVRGGSFVFSLSYTFKYDLVSASDVTPTDHWLNVLCIRRTFCKRFSEFAVVVWLV